MASFKIIKSPKLSIVLQLTEDSAPGRRLWEVHDVERNRGFRVTLPDDSLRETPAGRKPLERAFTENEIEGALGLAIEKVLVTPPEKVGGQMYEVSVSADDLYEAVELLE